MDCYSVSKHRINPHAPSVDSDVWPRCGHDKTDENTRMRGGKERCAICVKEADDRCNHQHKQRERLAFSKPLLEQFWR